MIAFRKLLAVGPKELPSLPYQKGLSLEKSVLGCLWSLTKYRTQAKEIYVFADILWDK